MRHVASRLGAVPMLRIRWDERDIAGDHAALLGLIGNGALAGGDDKDLIARVHMPLVRGAIFEMDLGEAQVATLFFANGGLIIDVASEDRIGAPLATRWRDPLDAHVPIVSHT